MGTGEKHWNGRAWARLTGRQEACWKRTPGGLALCGLRRRDQKILVCASCYLGGICRAGPYRHRKLAQLGGKPVGIFQEH